MRFLAPQDMRKVEREQPQPIQQAAMSEPEGFSLLADKPTRVWVHEDGRVATLGEPEEDDEGHNCDAMGCRWQHVLMWAREDRR